MKLLLDANRRDGFSIVELIFVVLVIGILATIATVSYSQVNNNAKKKSYDATAQQLKLKLGEFYTDNNRYPRLKSDVQTYLTSINAGSSIIDEFAKAEYQYAAYTNSAGTTLCATNPTCQHYQITINKSNWNGGSSDSNIVVKP